MEDYQFRLDTELGFPLLVKECPFSTGKLPRLACIGGKLSNAPRRKIGDFNMTSSVYHGS